MAGILIVTVSFYGMAQDKIQQSELDSLKLRIDELSEKIKKIQDEKEAEEKKAEFQKLLDQAKSMSQEKKKKDIDMERKFHSGLRQQSALNPNISICGDYYIAYGSSQSDYNRIPSEVSWGTGQFFLREMELGLQAPLDPFTRGKAYISFGREGVSLEEGYMQWLNLPLGMNIKMGEFKTQFGKLNRYHEHALPQFERPLVLTNFFGNTSLKGFGIGGNFLLPSIFAHVNELDLECITGGVEQSFTSRGKHNLILVTHFKNYWDLNRSTYFELGLSAAMGKNDPQEKLQTVVGGADLKIKWIPPGKAKYRGLEWRTEFLYSKRDSAGGDVQSWGFFSSLQCRLNARVLVSGRIDYSQIPWDSNLEEKGYALCLDYWQSEFVFIRFQYTHINRNFNENDHRLIFQTSWAMGPHKHEAY